MAEHLTVAQVVVGSSPIIRPKINHLQSAEVVSFLRSCLSEVS
ncbi:MAG: hypothetical protein RL275_2222 [Chloroflexota bacterium]|jgi:hypothetical protein